MILVVSDINATAFEKSKPFSITSTHQINFAYAVPTFTTGMSTNLVHMSQSIGLNTLAKMMQDLSVCHPIHPSSNRMDRTYFQCFVEEVKRQCLFHYGSGLGSTTSAMSESGNTL